jgi:hypothetical protein
MRTEVFTDIGYILTDLQVSDYVQQSKVQESSSLNYNSNVLLEIDIELENYRLKYYRKYMKAQFVLAEVGGMIKALLLMAIIINYTHNRTSFYSSMIASIFDIEDLHKYYGYYEEKNKKLYLKYRDSIALRNTKELFKRDRSNISSNPVRQINNYFTDLSAMRRSQQKLITERQKDNINEKINEDVNHESISDAPNSVDIGENKINNKNQGVNNINNSSSNSSIQSEIMSHNSMKKNKRFKANFERVKNDRFNLTFFEIIKFNCCCKNKLINKKRNILDAGKFLIGNRLEVTSILKKILEFDRFKNLVLKDHQIVLLNSLSRVLLDPETINLVEFKNITFDKFIDSLICASNSNSVIDHNLKEFVKSKFGLDK